MRTQRAIRRLRPDPVDDDVLLRCVELATRAPTGGNAQGNEFILVRDREVKAALGRQYRKAWAVYGGLGRILYGQRDKVKRIIDAVQWQVDHWEDVPVVVVACLRGVGVPVPPVMRSSRYGSIYPAVQNFLLAARAEGLGATLTTLPLWSHWAARRILGLPWSVEPVAAIPVGWPRGRYGPNTRRRPEQVVHVDRYGNKPFVSRRGRAAGGGTPSAP
jgi:nitroreductase